MYQRKTRLALTLCALMLTPAACSLTKPGGIDTPQGQLELETIYGVMMLGCGEVPSEEALKVDAGLALVQQLLVNKATNAEAVKAMDALKLPRRWRNSMLVSLRLAQKWVSAQIDQEAALVVVGNTVTNACREGLGQIS